MIPLGSSGGRQLTSTEDESKAFSCNSSGGVEGPKGESRAQSVIIQKISPHSCGMYIILMRDLTCVWTSCVFVSTPPGYSSKGPIRPRRESAVAQVTKDGTREHDRLTGFNNMIKKGSGLLLTLLG